MCNYYLCGRHFLVQELPGTVFARVTCHGRQLSPKLLLTDNSGTRFLVGWPACQRWSPTLCTAPQVVTRLVREYRVAVLPGSTFGLADGCYFRISFGPLKRDTAAEGLQRPGCAHCLVTMLVSTPDGWHIETPHLWTRVLVW